MALTPANIISLAKITQYLSLCDISSRVALQGGDLDITYPQLIYMERRSIEYQYNFWPANPGLNAALAYLYNLLGRYLFQAQQILGTGSGVIVIPGSGAGASLTAQQLQFEVGETGALLIAGQTVLVLPYANVVGGSLSISLAGNILPEGRNDQLSYTIDYTTINVTITFNQGAMNSQLYIISFLQLTPI